MYMCSTESCLKVTYRVRTGILRCPHPSSDPFLLRGCHRPTGVECGPLLYTFSGIYKHHHQTNFTCAWNTPEILVCGINADSEQKCPRAAAVRTCQGNRMARSGPKDFPEAESDLGLPVWSWVWNLTRFGCFSLRHWELLWKKRHF